MSTYLVTGGAGFVGSNLIGELVKRGETVRALDNLATGHIENLEQVKEKIQWHEADIRNLESIRPDFEGVDYVIHLAPGETFIFISYSCFSSCTAHSYWQFLWSAAI